MLMADLQEHHHPLPFPQGSYEKVSIFLFPPLNYSVDGLQEDLF
jgi:hypothetical protein